MLLFLLLSSFSIIIVAAADVFFCLIFAADGPALSAATTTATVTVAATQIAVIIISVCSFRILSNVAVSMCIFAISYRSTRVLQKVSALYFLKNLYLCYRHENNVTYQYNLPSSRYI